eukprot:89472_1
MAEGGDEKKQEEMINDALHFQPFDAEVNILTKRNMNEFVFIGYPHTHCDNSVPKNICDQTNRTTTDNWHQYGYQTSQDKDGIAYIQIDLQTPYYITKYAVSGYPGGKHRPNTVYYLRASHDADSWINVGMSDATSWTNGDGATYPFRHIQHVTDAGFYRYYQFYAVGYDNKHLLIMNAGLWTPQKVCYDQWKVSRNTTSTAAHPMAQWDTKHVVFWIAHRINWGNKTEEKHKCMNELRDWNVKGQDLIKADKDTLNSLNVKNPLIQQRILDARNTVLKNPQIVMQVMNDCDDSKIKIEQIENELQSLKKQVCMLSDGGMNEMTQVECDVLDLAASWSHYGGDYKQAKWSKIGNIVIVQGLIKSSNFDSQHMATLPQNCWPKQRIIFSLDQHSASFRVDVCVDGKITWVTGNNTHSWISLGGIVFVTN